MEQINTSSIRGDSLSPIRPRNHQMQEVESNQQQLKLVSIELQNFKSFEGHHVIGPFLNLTAVVGPNGGGKSNILDAIAFVLLLRHISKKHKHLKELIYREEQEKYLENKREMFVQLNFTRGDEATSQIAIRRLINAQGKSEYFVNGMPMLMEDYIQKISLSYGLNLNNFCIYQGKLEDVLFIQQQNSEASESKLTQMLEELSGSLVYKPQSEEFKQKLVQCEDQIKRDTESLQTLRLEKVKQKGLQEFAEQLNDCLAQQKQTEKSIHLTEILLADKTLQELELSLSEYERSLAETDTARQSLLTELRRFDLDQRKLVNLEEEQQRKVKQKKDELIDLQTNKGNRERLIESTKNMVRQKREMLEQVRGGHKQGEERIVKIRSEINDDSNKLAKIEEEIKQNEELQIQDAQRDEYLKIKSQIEQENAQIGRQISLVDQKLGYTNQKRANIYGSITQVKNSLSKDLNLETLQEKEKILKQELKEKQKGLEALNAKFNALKKDQESKKLQRAVKEKALLEKEFELKEIETEKQIRHQDTQTNQALEELKKRCKGYQGQLFELIKSINVKYDIPIKVALSKCLKYLVVDTPESSVYCTEFLKEKGLFKEVLVLSNVPDRQINHKLAKDLKAAEAYLVYDVVEVSRSHHLLDRAIRYFLNDKVVCDTFETAIKVQNQGIKDIVTYEGTEFKQGMISGGQHKNIFAVNLGQMQLDKDIKNLSNEVSKLQKELNDLTDGENGDSEHARVVKEVTKIETEIDIIKSKLLDVERQIKVFKENSSESKTQLASYEKNLAEIDKQLEQLNSARGDLHKDLKDAEAQAFSSFLLKYKLKSLKDYEDSHSTDFVKSFNERKNELIHRIEKNKSELSMLESSHKESAAVTKLESILKQEEEKLAALLSDQAGSDYVAKLQIELQTLDQELQITKKSKEDLVKAIEVSRNENNKLLARFESLQKDVNIFKIQIKNQQTKYQAKIEAGELSLILQPGQYIDFSPLGIENIQNQSKNEVDALMNSLTAKLKKLQLKEDEFNRNAALVPENDPNISLINDKIQLLKESVEKLSADRGDLMSELKKISEIRNAKFLEFFDKAASNVENIYQALTTKDSQLGQGGRAQLYLEDRNNPFDRGIHYTPQPPGKRAIYDVTQLSGGEKTVAALALIFSLIKIKKPPMLLMDEVDAFLDAENVKLVSDFMKGQLQTQTIMISHKEVVIKEADSLVGCSFVKAQKTSQAYSLDLRKYEA